MTIMHSKDISMTITSLSMKFVGLWLSANSFERKCRNLALVYTICTLVFSVWIQAADFYYSWGDLSTSVYAGCNTLCLLMALFKLFILFINRESFYELVVIVQEKFGQTNYDTSEQMILNIWKRKCSRLVCFFTFFIECSNTTYTLRPLLANIGKNETDRILPFNVYLDLPLSTTPYFEIAFALQTLGTIQVGVCYFCFDNTLCLMSLHVSSQFKVLQYRLANTNIASSQEKYNGNTDVSLVQAEKYYASFKSYIQHHQSLIEFCQKFEEVFTMIALGQVLIFSLLTCLTGYQVILADIGSSRRVTFILLLTGLMCQLLMFTYSCDCLIRESTNVAAAIYSGPWVYLPLSECGKMIRKDLSIVVMKSRRACCLTALRFFPVSLETYAGIMSTTMSYFTLLKQSAVDNMET